MLFAIVSAKSLFSGTPPFGMPHVNPTIETWGAGTKTPHPGPAKRLPWPRFSSQP